MKAELINKRYKENSLIIEDLLKNLSDTLNDADFTDINDEILDLIHSLEKPFMFVVIGEVKSGKSSFVNALTGEYICAVDADICTDKIHLIEYSDVPYQEHLGQYIEKRGVNSPILKDISIVDTPGTDSIISEHEEITRRFAPNSNIIFFVFPALNPHHSSSWDMLNIMKDNWSREIIFIAAQSDRCTPKELETGLNRIRTYAQERGIDNPVIFPTSSIMENSEDSEESGFKEIRSFITDTTKGGRHMILKLKDRISIAQILIDKTSKKLQERKDILQSDMDLRNRINSKYESGLDNSVREIDKIMERMNFVFQRTSGEYLLKLKKSLSTGSILKQAIPLPRFKDSKHKIDRNFLEGILSDMNKDLEKNLTLEATDNASFFIDGIKYRFSEIIREVEKARNLHNKKSGDDALNNFINRREEILKSILTDLTEMSTDLSLAATLEKHNPDIGDTVLKGGIVAVAGALLSFIAQGAIFDATGGILSALGVLGASGIILFKRNRLLKEFKRNVQESNDKFNEELHSRFKKRMELIFDDISRQFEKIDKHIEQESTFINSADVTLKETIRSLLNLQSKIS